MNKKTDLIVGLECICENYGRWKCIIQNTDKWFNARNMKNELNEFSNQSFTFGISPTNLSKNIYGVEITGDTKLELMYKFVVLKPLFDFLDKHDVNIPFDEKAHVDAMCELDRNLDIRTKFVNSVK